MLRDFIIKTGVVIAVLLTVVPVAANPVTTSWGGDAEMVYDTGFMHMLMKNPGGGVCLFNMDLVENDAPARKVYGLI